MTLRKAAEILGVSPDCLKRFLISHGLPVRRYPSGLYRFTPEDVQLIDRLMTAEGMSKRPELRLRKARRW